MPRRKPNVIVFFTDQQRFDTTGLHGNPMGLTPNFDRYGRQGTHLFNTISCQPLCGPARSCMQTGRYATQTGCWRNHIPLSPDAETLARQFDKGGWHTGYIGKWHLGAERSGRRGRARRLQGMARRQPAGILVRQPMTPCCGIPKTAASSCRATASTR
jgi:arylsulfatase A-like enzyme